MSHTTGRPCTICRHASRVEIDRALIAQEGFEAIARRFAVNPDSLARHCKNHVPTPAMAAGATAVAEAEGLHGGNLVQRANDLFVEAQLILSQAKEADELSVALGAIRESGRCLELIAKLRGVIDTSTTINVLVTSEWQIIQAAILSALAPYSDAKTAVSDALKKLA